MRREVLALARAMLVGVLLTGIAFAGLAGIGALAPTPAYAHNELVSTTPEDGSSHDEPPSELVLRFNGPVGKRFGEVAVTGPDQQTYDDGDLQVSGNSATQPLKQLGPQGKYVVGWRVVSADGHPISGSFSFWLGPKHSSPAPDDGKSDGEQAHDDGQRTDGQAQADGSGFPVVPVALGGALVLLVVVAAAWSTVRKRKQGSADRS